MRGDLEGRESERLPKAGQCVSVADLVTRGLPLLSSLPREAINKEIMAEQFTRRLCMSRMAFKRANHFFRYSPPTQSEMSGETQPLCDRNGLRQRS